MTVCSSCHRDVVHENPLSGALVMVQSRGTTPELSPNSHPHFLFALNCGLCNTFRLVSEIWSSRILTSVQIGGSESVFRAYMSLYSRVVERPPITNMVASNATALWCDRLSGPRPRGKTCKLFLRSFNNLKIARNSAWRGATENLRPGMLRTHGKSTVLV